MRNIISNNTNIKISNLPYEFTHIKYYTPQSGSERQLMCNIAFENVIKISKGIFVSVLNDNTKIFAIKFTPKKCMFPYIFAIDCTIYKDGFLIVGLDEQRKSFFKIIN